MENHIRRTISCSIVGQTNTGKSLFSAKLCLNTNYLQTQQIQQIQKQHANNKLPWELSILDEFQEEIMTGQTKEVALKQLQINETTLLLYDTPGHKQLINNITDAINYIDICIIVVSADINEFNIQYEKGTLKHHIQLSKLFGVQKVLIVINKADKCGWNQQQIKDILQKVVNYIVQNEFYQLNCIRYSVVSSTQNIGFKEIAHQCRDWDPKPVSRIDDNNSYLAKVIVGNIDQEFIKKGTVTLFDTKRSEQNEYFTGQYLYINSKFDNILHKYIHNNSYHEAKELLVVFRLIKQNIDKYCQNSFNIDDNKYILFTVGFQSLCFVNGKQNRCVIQQLYENHLFQQKIKIQNNKQKDMFCKLLIETPQLVDNINNNYMNNIAVMSPADNVSIILIGKIIKYKPLK